jgi:putative DNA primase/helicase
MATMSGAETAIRMLHAPLASSREPLRVAEAFKRTHHEIDSHATLVRWAHMWWQYDGVRFIEIDDEALVRNVYKFLDVVEVEKRDEKGVVSRERITARQKTAGEVQKALLGVMPMLGPNMPQWTKRFSDDPSPEVLVPCANGLLNMKTLELVKPTPRLFATNALGCAWDPKAVPPVAWLAFLESIWGADKESPRALQQMFGYFLTSDTSQQKLFALVGPKRSGKSTIARILKALLGDDAVVNPTLNSLERPFGMAPFVGKMLAIVGDARLGGRQDQATIVERLLSISGEDAISIDRKNRDPVNVRLRCRVLLITNELPQLYDTSGALASRFVILTMTKSFYGEEDTRLESRLLAELPGILKWAIEGRQDLAEGGRFTVPLASAEAIEEMEARSSPLTVFLREKCVVHPDKRVEIDLLYEKYKAWCKDSGRDRVSDRTRFGAELRTVLPLVKTIQLRLENGSRPRAYEGVGLA